MPLRRKSGAITAGRRSMKRIASERKKREALMAGGGASPPRKSSSANTSFLDEIDDPHGDYDRMKKEESSSYSPRGYTK
jgi:hypothetical protein